MKLTKIETPPRTRIDTTVGTRVFAGDVMLYGDTGLRRLASWSVYDVNIPSYIQGLEQMEVSTSRPGGIWIRRIGDTVILRVAYAKASQPNPIISPFPNGFGGSRSGSPYPAAPLGYKQDGVYKFSTMEIGHSLYRFRIPQGAEITSEGTGGYSIEITWTTNQPWPSSLPGTPA